ncbi:hypothetical protein H5410_012433 [Solanum commersonii]|uniref:Uncharacterized protein n=1 Tax=Solanum commersonii TaxID=4109 RepID=A0A9J6ASU4_SOLCO|nr:hypothetical protein H5410_012433 [Solanum commersonii]
MKKCHAISLHELETLQVENELINNRKSNDLLQIRECCHEDSNAFSAFFSDEVNIPSNGFELIIFSQDMKHYYGDTVLKRQSQTMLAIKMIL